jgi:hypothetical protein
MRCGRARGAPASRSTAPGPRRHPDGTGHLEPISHADDLQEPRPCRDDEEPPHLSRAEELAGGRLSRPSRNRPWHGRA